MSAQPEVNNYDATVYQLQTTDPVQGGLGGVSNTPLLNLANRTNYLYNQIQQILSGASIPAGVALVNSPTFTGSPKAPTAAAGDNSTLIATDAFVQNAINGITTINVAGNANVTLTQAQAGTAIQKLTGALTGNISVIVPTQSGVFHIVNNTTGAYNVTVKTAAGSGVVVTQGASRDLICDGINVFPVFNDLVGAGIAPIANPMFTGTVTASTFSGALNGNANTATTAGTVTASAQPAITSVGSLTSLTVNGAVNLNGITQITTNFGGSPATVDAQEFLTITNNTNIPGASFSSTDNRVFALAINTDNHVAIRTPVQLEVLTNVLTVTGAIATGGSISGSQFNGSGAGLTGTAAGLSIGGSAASANTANTATSANSANTAATCTGNAATATEANTLNINGSAITFSWSGQNGTPAYVWGANNLGTMQVWSPSQFTVASANTANTANSANTANTATSANTANSATTAGTVTTAAQPNITSVGTLTSLAVSGNITSGGTIVGSNVGITSDERLKENWQDLGEDFIPKLAALKSGKYVLKSTGQTLVGVGAQSLQTFLNEAVLEGEDGYLSVAYGGAALAACVELAKQNLALEAKLAILEKTVESLK